MGFFHRHRGLTPYLLLAPGIALAGGLLRRAARLPRATSRCESGNFDVGYAFTWAWGNYWDAIRDYRAAVHPLARVRGRSRPRSRS